MIIFHYLKQNVDYTHKITDRLSIENLNYLRSLTQGQKEVLAMSL